MFRNLKVNWLAMPDSYTGAVLPLISGCIPHAECNVNESLFPDCTKVRFDKSRIRRSELVGFPEVH